MDLFLRNIIGIYDVFKVSHSLFLEDIIDIFVSKGLIDELLLIIRRLGLEEDTSIYKQICTAAMRNGRCELFLE